MDRPKTIAIICNYKLNPDRIGGMDRFFKSYQNELSSDGHQLIWFFAGGSKFEFYSDFNIHFADGTSVEDWVLNYLDSEKVAIDIVVTHFTALCTNFYKELKIRKVKKIIAVDHNPRPLKGFSLKKQLKNRLKGFLFSKYIDAFVGVSDYTRQEILKDYGPHLKKKTHVVHNGIDYKRYKRKNSEDRSTKKFIVVSHLRYSKGIQDLLKALILIPEKTKKNIKIDIYGEGPFQPELEEIVEVNNIRGIIDFRGSSSQLPEILHNYDYLIQPTHMECFSLSLLESLAANVPVLTTTVGGNLELIEDGVNGFIFEPQDILALAEILGNVITENKKIESDVFPKIVQDFPLSKMVSDHIKITLCT
ncbi:MAG TPA: glycosyltransferase family 4 protein [Salinimicrobium sp.]|nr:glycosyltransferase family 4 protein [Salinimicrobium sp.]